MEQAASPIMRITAKIGAMTFFIEYHSFHLNISKPFGELSVSVLGVAVCTAAAVRELGSPYTWEPRYALRFPRCSSCAQNIFTVLKPCSNSHQLCGFGA